MYSGDFFFQQTIGEFKTGEEVSLTVKVRYSFCFAIGDEESTVDEVLIFTDETCRNDITNIVPHLSPETLEDIEKEAKRLVDKKYEQHVMEAA